MITTKKRTPTENAKMFVAKCREYGFTFTARPNVVTIEKRLVAGDPRSFAETEMESSIIFDYCPLRGGSVWGTDGGSIGGATAMQTGQFKMNKSGSGAAFVKAISRIR